MGLRAALSRARLADVRRMRRLWLRHKRQGNSFSDLIQAQQEVADEEARRLLHAKPRAAGAPETADAEAAAVLKQERLRMHSSLPSLTDQPPSADDDGGYFGFQADVAARRRGVPWGTDWDKDWDGRAEKTRQMRTRVGESLRLLRRAAESGVSDDDPVSLVVPPGPRILLMVRHGQYHEGHDDDADCTLTERGVMQAGRAARRVHEWTEDLGLAPTDVHLVSSDLQRAQETAAVIAKELGVSGHRVDPSLREGFPCQPSPCRRYVAKWIAGLTEEEKRKQPAEMYSAFLTFFGRPTKPVTVDVAGEELKNAAEEGERWRGFSQPPTLWVLACHTNLIRYFVCCALQLPPEAWARMKVGHASITAFSVTWDGHVQATGVGDQGHLPLRMQTV
eukprot:TRINITY_DN1415_c1_g2_i1.p1 TRINITY_DN1415_c1_g2~~TRINITY_DN1415_c1_g2_i1.p1  ORF type:complete len:392 (+),score=114.87 TRINITY_DN1415_c1_g2_i1:48-1223(+)